MKKIIGFFVAFLYFTVYAQDKIIDRNGDTLNVKIIKSTPETISFFYEGEEDGVEFVKYKNIIHKIIYKSGRIEFCSERLAIIKGPDDWEKVIITYLENDIKDLTKVGEVKFGRDYEIYIYYHVDIVYKSVENKRTSC